MIVTCERCATQFQLDDGKVKGEGIRVRCSRCKHAFFVAAPGAPQPPAEDEIDRLVRRFKPFSAHRVLRTFFEAYQVVGDALARHDPGADVEEAAFLRECLAIGRQYRLQRRIGSAESVSRVLFQTALKLADNRGLLDPGGAERAEERRAFAEELRDALRRVDAIAALAASRRAGLID